MQPFNRAVKRTRLDKNSLDDTSTKHKRRFARKNIPTDNLTNNAASFGIAKHKKAISVSQLRRARSDLLEAPDTITTDISSSPQPSSPFGSSQRSVNDNWPASSDNKGAIPSDISTPHRDNAGANLQGGNLSVNRSISNQHHPSSDDNIFWAITPDLNHCKDNRLNIDDPLESPTNKGTLSSSPLRAKETLGVSNVDSIAQILDPDLKRMIDKYNKGPSELHKTKLPRLSIAPSFLRSSSDPRALGKRKMLRTVPGQLGPIIARKSTLSESFEQSFHGSGPYIGSKLKEHKGLVGSKDVSQLLVEIGSKLSKERGIASEEEKEENIMNHDEAEDSSENEFSDDDIDMMEIDQLANEARKERMSQARSNEEKKEDAKEQSIEEKKTDTKEQSNEEKKKGTKEQSNEISSEDSFTDDGDEVLEMREKSGAVQKKKVSIEGRKEISIEASKDTGIECRKGISNKGYKDINIEGRKDISTELDKSAKSINIKVTTETKIDVRKDSKPANKDFHRLASKSTSFKDMKVDRESQYVEDINATNGAKACILKKDCHRFQIKKIIKSHYKGSHEQLILRCISPDDTMQNVVVRDFWTELEFKENDIINIVLDNGNANPHLVDKVHNLLIWNPDTLLSATMVSQSINCPRVAVINNKFQGPGEFAIPMLVGNIVHRLFQQCLIERNIDTKFMLDIVDEELDANILPIMSAQSDRESVKKLLIEHMAHIKTWMKTYVPKEELHGLVGTGESTSFSDTVYPSKTSIPYKVTNVLDVEENIMSPMFGIRGLIDVVIEAMLINKGSKYVVPMEIKTGREYITNRAQASLYTLLVRDRYDLHTDLLSLVYTKSVSSYFEALRTNDLRMLVNIRNKLSRYMVSGMTSLPPIKKAASCERCPVLSECMALNCLTEDGDAGETGIDEATYNALTEFCVDPAYKQFYQHWNEALTKEEALLDSFKKNLWCLSSKEREENGGKAVGNLRVVGATESTRASRKYMYWFTRDKDTNASMMLSQLSRHDRIIVSDEQGKYGLAYGFVENIREDSIIINTDRKWINSSVRMKEFNESGNQVFQTVLESSSSTQRRKEASTQEKFDEQAFNLQIPEVVAAKTYRVDKDEMFHGMALARFNILNLFLSTGDQKRREMVVDLKPPRFSETPLVDVEMDTSDFNIDQKTAFNTVLRTQDYCLILGMPGTGKTTVVAKIIAALAKAGKSVLIASYTHSAVDNIVEKLLDITKKPSVLRVGSPARISDKVRKYSLYSEDSIYQVKTQDDFDSAVMNTQIVAATCLGINDLVFIHRRNFDYCIVDEASQVSMPVCLGPLALCDKFVLVGDHYQLPPLILSAEARAGGLDKSLFRRLSEAHPESVVQLSYQYRMCSDIMAVSNTLIYECRLKCGDDKVAHQTLHVPFLGRVEQKFASLPLNHRWIDRVLAPETKVLFINHDEVPAREVCHGDKIENPTEAKLIVQLVKTLILGGVDQNSIGIMSFYKAQLRFFYRSFGSMFPDLDILTADRFQGRDKECIIISLVRSNDNSNAGDLLKEWRRVNVAMTRAKSKLIVFGSRKLMSTVPQFEGFIELFDSKSWFLNLPASTDTVYSSFLDFGSQQSSPKKKARNHSIKRFMLSANSAAIQKTSVVKDILDEESRD